MTTEQVTTWPAGGFHLEDPCVFCGAHWDDVDVGDCPGWTPETLARLGTEVERLRKTVDATRGANDILALQVESAKKETDQLKAELLAKHREVEEWQAERNVAVADCDKWRSEAARLRVAIQEILNVWYTPMTDRAQAEKMAVFATMALNGKTVSSNKQRSR